MAILIPNHRALCHQTEIEQDLKDAAEEHQLEIYLQPKYRVSDCTITGLEEPDEKGVRITIDDFGTGYSSLNYFRFLGIDDLKIDKTFVGEILNEKGGVIIKSIIDIAVAHDIRVVAEGVETDEQLRRLREMGCHLCQGYLLSKPLPVEDAIELFCQKSSGQSK